MLIAEAAKRVIEEATRIASALERIADAMERDNGEQYIWRAGGADGEDVEVVLWATQGVGPLVCMHLRTSTHTGGLYCLDCHRALGGAT